MWKWKKNSTTKIHKGLQSLLPRESCFWIQNTKYRSLSAVHLKLWWSKMFFSLLRFIRGLMPPKRVAIQWKPERTKHLPMDIGSLTSKDILHGIISVLHILVHVGWRVVSCPTRWNILPSRQKRNNAQQCARWREATHLQMSKWGEDWSPASLPNMSHLRPLHIDNHGGPCWCGEPGPWPDELPGQLYTHAKSVRISMTVLSELGK